MNIEYRSKIQGSRQHQTPEWALKVSYAIKALLGVWNYTLFDKAIPCLKRLF